MLVVVAEGTRSFSELADEFGLREPELKNRLEMMVRMGYLEAIHAHEVPEEELHCHGCLMAARCKDDDCSDGPPVVGYRLTEKGRRVASSATAVDKSKVPQDHSQKKRMTRGSDDTRRGSR
jgi:DNA-binding HxlR family transcriptional regulator